MRTLVIGGRGIIGGNVVQRLTRQGVAARCLYRSGGQSGTMQRGEEAASADYRPETLPALFEGMDSLFLYLPVSSNGTREALAAVEAVRASTIKKIVYVSVFMPAGSEAAIPCFRNNITIEQAVRQSGAAYTILRPNHYFQSDLPMRRMIMRHNIYPLPIGTIGLNRVDVRDVADAAVNALIHSGYEGRLLALHGPHTLTGPKTASIYGACLGSNVRYAGNDLIKWERRVKNVLPDRLFGDQREMYRFFQEHGMVAPEADLKRQRLIVRHEPRSFRDFAEEAAHEWKPAPSRAA